MKTVLRLLVAIAIGLGAVSAHAQREFSQGELDAVLAPIALYPDPLVTLILNASMFPQDVAAALAWSRANPQLQGDAALAAVDGQLWNPSVKALVTYPDVLSRTAESPQWLADLGEAYTGSPDAVNAEIQQLRSRAQATGNLQSNAQQYVYQQGQDIVVQPVYPSVIYAPYYNPYIVYGTWWWPAYRPVYWRPWVWRPVVVTRVIAPVRIVRPMRAMPVSRPVQVTPFHQIPESRRAPIVHSGPLPQSSTQWNWQRAPISRAAPAWTPPARVAAPMPAPQVRFNEPRFNRGYQAATGGGFRSGGGGGAMHSGGGQHRG
ncbi:MAG TPA: DUF3300 domain-containing protein [Burkholderiales bacterium]|nr:DUF3300 domain-containing protein [Burkholderiales bacterium]